ncbi:MAG: MoaD/ThiS family protein [Parasphingorhabdus sp.]
MKERLGKGQEAMELSSDLDTISDLVELLCRQAPEYTDVFADLTKLRFALDQEFTSIDASIKNAEELAIFPPVTGG